MPPGPLDLAVAHNLHAAGTSSTMLTRTSLKCRYLQRNRLSGQLPGSWGSNSSWPLLRFLYLDDNPLGGEAMLKFSLGLTRPLHRWALAARRCCGPSSPSTPPLGAGTLPPEWGFPGSFPSLRVLGLNSTQITGDCL